MMLITRLLIFLLFHPKLTDVGKLFLNMLQRLEHTLVHQRLAQTASCMWLGDVSGSWLKVLL